VLRTLLLLYRVAPRLSRRENAFFARPGRMRACPPAENKK
jgi:hypothetical protein